MFLHSYYEFLNWSIRIIDHIETGTATFGQVWFGFVGLFNAKSFKCLWYVNSFYKYIFKWARIHSFYTVK